MKDVIRNVSSSTSHKKLRLSFQEFQKILDLRVNLRNGGLLSLFLILLKNILRTINLIWIMLHSGHILIMLHSTLYDLGPPRYQYYIYHLISIESLFIETVHCFKFLTPISKPYFRWAISFSHGTLNLQTLSSGSAHSSRQGDILGLWPAYSLLKLYIMYLLRHKTESYKDSTDGEV